MKAYVSRIGEKIGRLTIISEWRKWPKTRDKFIYYTCICDCGIIKEICGKNLIWGKTRSCGCLYRERKGVKNPNWKGGRRIGSDGYVLVRNPSHPRADRNGYVRENILVLEAKTGRSLLSFEFAHHKDENKLNNDPNNLEIMLRSLHTSFHQRGEKSHLAKLTEEEVLEIRAITGKTQQEIADKYGVCKDNIQRILHRKTWKHL